MDIDSLDSIEIEIGNSLEKDVIRLMKFFEDLLSKFNEATAIIAITRPLGRFVEDDKVMEIEGIFSTVKDKVEEFVKSYWNKDHDIFMGIANTPTSGLKLIIVIFGIPSLVRQEDINKILQGESISPVKLIKRKEEKDIEIAIKALLNRWIVERLKEEGLNDVLEKFRKGGIASIEVYSIKNGKFVGQKPRFTDTDEAIPYLVARTILPF